MLAPTMSINEVLTAKRARGLPASPERERAFLLAGKYPYGIAVQGDKNLIPEIYRVRFEIWLNEVAPPEAGEKGCIEK